MYIDSGVLLLADRNTRPVVRAERRSRQTFLIIEIAYRVVRPGITHSNGLIYLVTADFNGIAIDFCISPNKFTVSPGPSWLGQAETGNGKTLQWPAPAGSLTSAKITPALTNNKTKERIKTTRLPKPILL